MAVSRLNHLYVTNETIFVPEDESLAELSRRLEQFHAEQDQTIVEVPASKKKPRGGQFGNTNALKHGFYASVFNPEEIRKLDQVAQAQLVDEVALVRVLIKRTVISMNVPSNLDLPDHLHALRVITFAASCIEKLERTRRFVFDEHETMSDIINRAIDLFWADMAAKGFPPPFSRN
jgi:hypothetical protein